MSEETFTLAEAKAELARRECRDLGHSWDFEPWRLMDEAPPGIFCATCGWRGTVTMESRP